MTTRLYLDSARMGLLSERAKLAHFEYVRLAATEGCSLYFSRLLENGFSDWPGGIRRSYPALGNWQGIRELERALQRLAGVTEKSNVLLASRTALLIKLAMSELCRRCQRVLVTDLTWPSYRKIFDEHRRWHPIGVSTVNVRRYVRQDRLALADIITRFERDYENMGCDGFFLPAISHDGIRLPIDDICERLNKIRPLKFVVIDGAQAFGHVSEQLGLEHCDIFISGTHKWLQGHLPMGLAFLPKDESSNGIEKLMLRMLQAGKLDDPLLAFTQELKSRNLQMFSETVNLASLFSCRAALADGLTTPETISHRLNHRRENADRVRELATECNWIVLPELLPTGIVMLQSSCPQIREKPPDWTRNYFASLNISLSTYDDGIIRLAMPQDPLTHGDMDLLAWALQRCMAGPMCVRPKLAAKH